LTRFRWTSEYHVGCSRELDLDRPNRYEIEGDAPGWADAEKQVASAAQHGRNGAIVSVKGSSIAKRKAGATAAEVYEEVFGEKRHKKSKKGAKR
jgi:N-acetyltransferase 10